VKGNEWFVWLRYCDMVKVVMCILCIDKLYIYIYIGFNIYILKDNVGSQYPKSYILKSII
jgi:hypothetical protein